MKLKCDRNITSNDGKEEICNYEWEYKGEGLQAICPRCRGLILVRTHKVVCNDFKIK